MWLASRYDAGATSEQGHDSGVPFSLRSQEMLERRFDRLRREPLRDEHELGAPVAVGPSSKRPITHSRVFSFL